MSDHALFLTKAYASQSLEVKPITRLLPQPEDTLVQKPSYFVTKVILLYDSSCILLSAGGVFQSPSTILLSVELGSLGFVCCVWLSPCSLLCFSVCHLSYIRKLLPAQNC